MSSAGVRLIYISVLSFYNLFVGAAGIASSCVEKVVVVVDVNTGVTATHAYYILWLALNYHKTSSN